MKSTTAPLARTAPTDGLAEMVQRPGPFLTVVLDADGSDENASQRSQLRWRAQRDEAARLGVPERILAAVDPLVADAHLGGPARYVVVGGESGEVLLDEALAALPDAGPLVRWGPLPSLVPLLADRQARLPHVVVRCDREGADVLAVDADGRQDRGTVKGGTRPYRHARSVGWRELTGWHRAERQVARTAEQVAQAAQAAAAGIGADLVVVAGDDRTVDEVVAHCRAHGLDARPVAGGRGDDGSEEQVDAAAATLVRTAVAEHVVAALQRFREQLAHTLAVDGDHAVAGPLAAGQVDVLLVHDGDAERAVVDEAVRRALATSAGILVVPNTAGPRNGVGALLRWR